VYPLDSHLSSHLVFYFCFREHLEFPIIAPTDGEIFDDVVLLHDSQDVTAKDKPGVFSQIKQ